MSEPTNMTLAEHLKVLVDERFRNSDNALQLAKNETERRLAILNGEAERLRQMQETYVSKEVYLVEHRTMMTRVSNLERIVFIGVGIVLVAELLFRFIKPTQ